MGRRHAHRRDRRGARSGASPGRGDQALVVAAAHVVVERSRDRWQGARCRPPQARVARAGARLVARVLPGSADGASDRRDHADRRHLRDSGARRRASAPDRHSLPDRRSIRASHRRAGRLRRRRGRLPHRSDRIGDRRPMKAVNLLPREDAPRKATGGRSNAVVIVAAAGSLLVVLALVVATTIASSHVSSARADLDASRAEIARTPAHASSSLARNRLLSARERRTLALASTLSRRVAWDRILRRLALVLPGDVWLTDLAGDTPTGTLDTTATAAPATPGAVPTGLQIDGYSYSHAAVARLLSRLEVVPDLKDVQLQTSTAEELNGVRVVRFTIAADIRRGGDAK